MPLLHKACSHLLSHAHRLRPRARDDRGSATTEMVLAIMVAITIATVVGGILLTEFTSAARSIDLGVDR